MLTIARRKIQGFMRQTDVSVEPSKRNALSRSRIAKTLHPKCGLIFRLDIFNGLTMRDGKEKTKKLLPKSYPPLGVFPPWVPITPLGPEFSKGRRKRDKERRRNDTEKTQKGRLAERREKEKTSLCKRK